MNNPKDDDSFTTVLANTDLAIAQTEDHTPVLVTPAIKELTEVPYFSETDSIARDVLTKIAAQEQRKRELAGDLESVMEHRNGLIDQIQEAMSAQKEAVQLATDQAVRLLQATCDQQVTAIRDNGNKLIDIVNANQSEEIAIIRGRETDIDKGLSYLRGLHAQLQR